MADMFKEAGLIPNNIYFSNAWIYNGLIKNSDYEPNYYVNHSGRAIGSYTYWGAIGEKYGVVSKRYDNRYKTQINNTDAIFVVGNLKNGVVEGSIG
ncbi:hypothetical protein [Prevotella jejuni]|jgi:hypothetical protein|uniref:hypothetical protein n=1 Tax=Prevotella jejuni TaxID=1177574 RepID=UPI003211AB44